jgi:CRISPR system Cascade subunit CasD
MDNPYLLLWLEAPLQSWGHDSKFGRRDTLGFPTKSGILGLVCCALGAGGAQRELLAALAPLDLTVIAYALKQGGGPAKRLREPLLRDFQMVGSGYDDQDPWQTLHIPKTSEGKKAVGGGTKMTYRYYLQDACFAALLQVPAGLSKRIADALQNPVWDLYLGRKNCAPADFIFRGCFDSGEQALLQAQAIAQEKNLLEDFRVLQGACAGDETLTLNDVPVQFGERKLYRDRQVTVLQP